ncbi:hypothetical protein Tco_1423775 [Tanacetum coccineum]
MMTMAENVIVAGTGNLPPMLEKGMYDSWKTRICLYIKGEDNGEMLIDSIVNGPFQLKKEITIPGVNGAANEKHQQDFLADRLEEMDDSDDLQLHTTSNFKANHVDAYDLDCDDVATACAIFIKSLSPA